MAFHSKISMPIIENKYFLLTQTEKGIADFFIKNTSEIDFNQKVIANKLFVSEASLSRFAKKLGFSGYREFIYHYKNSIQYSSLTDNDSSALALNTYQEILNKSLSLIDKKQLERIVNYLSKARRIFTCGKGSSGSVACEMESRFIRIGLDIDSIIDSDRMKMQTVFMDTDSLILAFSLSGETAPVRYMLKEAFNRGAKTIFFTANTNPSIAAYCSEIVKVASIEQLEYGNIISPQFPFLIIIDMIYHISLNRNINKNTALYINTLKALKD